jgi:EmrB/QacA subfamily drug resistance transporter
MSFRIVPLVVASALFMEGMDATILATALPTIARDLGVDPISLKLAITSYLVGLAIFIPVSAWVADRFGARSTFRAALVLYLLASVGCAFSSTIESFVVWRFVQGVGGAMMTPVGRMVIVKSVPKAELVSALAALTIPALFGPLLGPLIGGVIVTYTDWRWIFLVNVPIGLAGIVLATLYFDDERPAATPLDWRGFLLSAAAFTGLIAGATALGRNAAPVWAVALAFGIGAGASVLYVRHALRVERPLLDIRLFSLPTFDAGITGGALFRLAIGAAAFLLPLMLQIALGLDAMTSGLLTFLGAAGALLMKFCGKAILDRFGFRRVLVVNTVIAVGSVAALAAIGPGMPLGVIGALIFVGGFTRSLQFTSMHALSYADINASQAGPAAAISSVAQQVSLSLGVAIGALALEMSQSWNGRSVPAAGDFAVAYLAVSAIAILAIFKMQALAPGAGNQLRSGRDVPE